MIGSSRVRNPCCSKWEGTSFRLARLETLLANGPRVSGALTTRAPHSSSIISISCKLTNEIVHNLAIIDALLNDRSRFPIVAKTEGDKEALLLKAQLQAVADQQRKILNVLYGLSDTLSLQELVAKGDGMQGATGGGGSGAQVGQGDQDVSFQDVLSASARGRGGPVDPTVDQDPAISQAPTELSNSPIARFYLGVAEQQRSTASAENALTQTVLDVAATCRR